MINAKQEQLLSDVRHLVSDVRTALAWFDISTDDQAALKRSSRQLEELFLLVVVGEFNAGKSAFINALLGERVLKEGVTPTTASITLLKHGTPASMVGASDGMDLVTAPAELLREITIVDTPGTNAILRQHEVITREFVPRSDLVFFITSADRPFTESERLFLERIREWGKNVVIVLNKVDILESGEDVGRIEAFIVENARALLKFAPDIVAVSARLALQAKQTGDASLLAQSGFERLEKYMNSRLDEAERFRLKLLNPLGVALRLLDTYSEIVEDRLKLLKQDSATIEQIQSQLAIYREDMERGFRLRLTEIENTLLEIENRGDEFFEDVVRLTRVFDLVNKSRIKSQFEAKVVGDAPAQIERRVHDIIDWLLSSDLQQWESVKEQLSRRRSEHSGNIPGDVIGRFDFDRTRLLDTLGRTAQRTLENYDKDAESRRMAESVQAAVANAALLEVGAVGLGTAVSLVASTTAADVTGLLAAGALAAIGLFVIPHRRRSAKRELRSKIGELREQLMKALNSQFKAEMERSLRRLDEAMVPYTRFVRTEADRLAARLEEFTKLREQIMQIKTRIQA